jgi:hypothetical protein
VLVYKELNEQEGFQPDGDWLVAVNGGRYSKSRADQRKKFTTDFKTFKSDKTHSYSKWRKAGHGGLSGSNIVAKIVGAVASANQLQVAGGVEGYAKITARIYNHFKTPIVKAFRDEFQIPLTPSEKSQDTSEAKIVKSKQFKAALLVSLATSDVGAIVVGVVQGRGIPRSAFKVVSRGSLRGICADMAAHASRAIEALSRSYNIDLSGVSQEFGAEYGGVVPERRVAPRSERPAHTLGQLQRLPLTGPSGEGDAEVGGISTYRLPEEGGVDDTEEF